MNIKTMEGLAGANTSIQLISTPMSVAKEAERKGDTEKLKRALSYASEMADQAEQYGKNRKIELRKGKGNRKKPVSMWQKSAKKANIRWRWQTHHLRCLQSSHKM